MAYSRPKSYGYTQTPAPGGGGGGGDPWAAWVDIPAAVGGWVIYQDAAWSVTNPTPDTLRVTSLTTGTARNWTPTTQAGIVLIWPQAQSPFPVVTPTGLTGPPWDGEHAVFKMRAKVTKGSAFVSPNSIHGGTGFVTYTNDQGAAPAGPVFSVASPEPSWFFTIQMVDSNTGNNAWNPAWASSGQGGYSTNPPGLPPYGDVGQANEVAIQTGAGNRHAGALGQPERNEAVSMYWSDTRTPAVPPQWAYLQPYPGPASTGELKIDGKYLYPALFVANFATNIQIGDWFEFADIQMLVQQVRGRDS